MVDLHPIPKRIAIVAPPEASESLAEAKIIARFLQEQGVETVAWGNLEDPIINQRIASKAFDALIGLGGDGTMLKMGSIGAPLGLPILGINHGRFGFLTEIQRDQWRETLPLLLEGRYWLEERMMLHAEQIRSGQKLASWPVINEVVVCRGQFVRPIQVQADVDGRLLYNFIADGLIASTPTGSTAYALAAGGPILPPELRNILIIPVAPHLSMDRAIILSEGAEVTMTVHTLHEAVMSVDGHPPISMLDGDAVRVIANHTTVHFIRFRDRGYFYRNITAYMGQNPTAGNRQ